MSTITITTPSYVIRIEDEDILVMMGMMGLEGTITGILLAKNIGQLRYLIIGFLISAIFPVSLPIIAIAACYRVINSSN